jgi:hypothetical protein
MATKTKKTTKDNPNAPRYGLQHRETKLLLTMSDEFTNDPAGAFYFVEAAHAQEELDEIKANPKSLQPDMLEVVLLNGYVPPVVQGELLPTDAGTAVPVASSGTLALSSPGSALMTATALKAHAADLKKLAKGARDLSQHKEALTFEQNATLIEETLLTQLEPQAKLPFGYADVKKALGDRISGKLRAKLVTAIKRDTPLIEGDKDGKERTAKIEQRIDDFEALVGNVASIVTALVEPVISQAAERGMLAGRLARETTAVTLALEAVEAVANA